MINWKGKQYVCSLDLGFELIRGKWKAVILCHLNSGPKRFGELQRITCGVSQKMLTQQLRELEDDGLIQRIVYPEVPPKVEYALTEQGEKLFPALELIQQWAKDYVKECNNS